MGNNISRKVENKYVIAWRICIYVGVLVIVAFMTFSIATVANSIYINKHVVKTAETTTEKTDTSIKYLEIPEVCDNLSQYIDQQIVICGYMCNEVGSETGIAWLATKPEMYASEAGDYIIRLENDEVFEWTAFAIAVQGILTLVPDENGENALVLKNANIYKYDGDNTSFLFHNALIEAEAVNVIAIALSYNNETEVYDYVTELEQIALQYGRSDLFEIFEEIAMLTRDKHEMTQEDFEEQAEPLWDKFVELALSE